MFKFFKDKLKKAIGRFSKDVETEQVDTQDAIAAESGYREPKIKEPKAKSIPRTEKSEIAKEQPIEPEDIEIPKESSTLDKTDEPDDIVEELPKPAEDRPKSFFANIKDMVTKSELSESKFDELFFQLEIVLLENNVAVEVIEKIKDDLKTKLVNSKIPIGSTRNIIEKALANTIDSLFAENQTTILKKIEAKSPYVMLFLGVNGAGKTTTIAKLAYKLQNEGKKCVIAAADTFRAAAIQQLEEHADKLGIRLIKHDYGGDPAAVAYDSIKYAEARGIDVVLIDTAGRQHSNSNLMEEMKKIVRISNPDMKIFVGESITGNDCIEQARSFDAAVGIDGIILSKADVDEKGGTAISISYVTKRPILFIGTGQGYDDLTEFDKALVTKGLELA